MAAEHLEERQTDWAYSKPVVVLDVLWNPAFVAVAAAMLVASPSERPAVPLRFWLVGYVIQCLLHVLCVTVEYKCRRREARAGGAGAEQEAEGDRDFKISMVKHLESANTMFSFIWWIIGFYWVSACGEALSKDAPQLCWLSIVFLAFDVFFVVFCVALACVIGIAVCCCLPCIIAILYAVTDRVCQFPLQEKYIIENAPANPSSKSVEPLLPLVKMPGPESSRENSGVMWISSPDQLEDPRGTQTVLALHVAQTVRKRWNREQQLK